MEKHMWNSDDPLAPHLSCTVPQNSLCTPFRTILRESDRVVELKPGPQESISKAASLKRMDNRRDCFHPLKIEEMRERLEPVLDINNN